MKKERVWEVLALVVILFAYFVVRPLLAPILKGEKKPVPDPIAEEPTDPTPADPVVEPIDPELVDLEPSDVSDPNPLNFKKDGPASVKSQGIVLLDEGYDYLKSTLLCTVPKGTEISLKVDSTVTGGGIHASTGEESVVLVQNKSLIVISGIVMSDELVSQLRSKLIIKERTEASPDVSVELLEGAVLGTVGAPLKKDWGGANLVIIIISEYDDIINCISSSIIEELH
ncbi:MAG TPA: hypothetical protein PLH22_01940 [Candidatus Colwellbacteria bacterium]|nr:hypothetical protein [Candidatus Colwellbacteria bacterium]